MKKIFLFGLFCIIFLSFVSATSIHDWYGTLTIDTNTSTDGAVVIASINDVAVANHTVGSGGANSGYYILSIPGSSGNTVVFKVYGVIINEGNKSWTSSPVDGTFLNISMNKTADDTSCTYSAGCAGGYCCFGATEYTDGSGTGTCQSSACAAAAVTTTTGGGGSGGAGGGGGAAAAVSESQTITTISAGGTATTTFIKTAIAVTNIIITSLIDATNVRITVTEASQPVDSPDPIAAAKGGVYKYIRITESLIGDDNLKTVKIKFKVERSWFKDNNYDEETVKLMRYKGGKWVILKTTKIKSSSKYVYYEAESPGLTTFAITAEKKIKYTAFEIIDTIKEYYQGISAYDAFEIIDTIKKFYGG